MTRVVHDIDAADVDLLGLVAGHYHDRVNLLLAAAFHQTLQQRLAIDRQHDLGTLECQILQTLAATGGKDHCACFATRLVDIATFGLGQFIGALQTEDFLHTCDLILDRHQGLIGVDLTRGILHRIDRAANKVISPDDETHTSFAKHRRRRAVVLGRHDDQRRAIRPFAGELEDLIGG